jgi:glucokinase
MHKIIIGTDIGGSHITCMAVNPLNHVVLQETAVWKEVDCHAPAESILAAWAGALNSLVQKMGRKNLGGIGFAMPGPFDYPAGIAWFKGVKKYDGLYGINIREEMQQRLNLDPATPVRFLNDATCFAIGEAWLGKASAFRRNMAITLGTGFGSAFILEGIPVESGDEVPLWGCVYHLPYGKSIANDYFSTSWFLERYQELTSVVRHGVREIAEEVTSCEVNGLAGPVSGIFEEFGESLGNFLAPWLIKFRAGCLTIGGNIANSFGLFEKQLLYALSVNQCRIPVFISGLGEMAAIAGAARLCDDRFYSRLPHLSNK